MALDIVITIMMKVTKKKMEILVIVIFLLTTWCGGIYKMILSYETYQIITVVQMGWRKVWRIYLKKIEWIILTSGMSLECFFWVIAQSNKSDWLRSVLAKFGGIKWKNITVQDMVRFYGVMLHMSIDPCCFGGYACYLNLYCMLELYTSTI